MSEPNKKQRDRYIEARDRGILTPSLIRNIDHSTAWTGEDPPRWWSEMMETYRNMSHGD